MSNPDPSKKEPFRYSYSAPTRQERREILEIRNDYLPPAEKSDIEQIRALDKRTKTFPRILALCLGIVGVLVFGTGFTMLLEWAIYLWGAVVAAVGVALMVVAHPVYTHILNRNKAKYGPEILRLSQKALGEESKNE